MSGEEATQMFRKYLEEDQLGNTANMPELLDKLQYSPLEIIQACKAISASASSAVEYLQHAVANSRDSTTQSEKCEEQQQIDQEGQADQQIVEPQPAPTDETPTAVAPLPGEVKYEAKEDVWGYLVRSSPTKGGHDGDPVITLRKRGEETGAGVEEIQPSTKGKKINQESRRRSPETARSDSKFFGGYLIGRHRNCDLIINDPIVSNRHCLIYPQNRGKEVVALLEDLSMNGTFVNEAIVGRNLWRELQDNDEIAINDNGRFVFRYPVTRPKGNTFLENYTILERIKKGYFAEVFVCIEMSTGRRYALKLFSKHHGVEDRSVIDRSRQEIAVSMGISHPNIVRLKETFQEENATYLVMDLAPAGDLFDLVAERQKLTETETRKIFLQLFKAVKYLHDFHIVHRDIKPENILVSGQDWNVKITDFGLAKVVRDGSFTTTLCGSPSYVAPEVLKDGEHRKYSKKVDVWSLGVVLYVCLCGFPPFSDELRSKDFPYTLSEQIRGGRFGYPSPYWDSVGDPALDLIDHMLVVMPHNRYTIEQCMVHPWMTQSQPVVLLDPSRRSSRVEGQSVPLVTRRERTLLSTINNVGPDEGFSEFEQTSPPYK
ncbi:kinase-like domain-containing protein [Xylaria intraflava]|nr:kinase-like domain-containing protein [Xylaria intraflava]